jgi:hypothetical protein
MNKEMAAIVLWETLAAILASSRDFAAVSFAFRGNQEVNWQDLCLLVCDLSMIISLVMGANM